MSKISFNKAVSLLDKADLVLIQCPHTGEQVIATYNGWEDEGNEKSNYIVGADTWNDVYLRFGKDVEFDYNILKPSSCSVVLELYSAARIK